MTTESGTPAGEIAAPADTSEISLTEARAMIDAAYDEPEKQPAESAKPATADPELSKDNSAPETDPAEATPETDPAEDQPSIDPPRSWTQAEKERFQSLPRETQEYLSHREQERETALRRSQNDIADQRKAIEAKAAEAEQAKQQYLSKIPSLEDIQRFVQQGPFADIKTQDDADALATNDPFRYLQWDTYQKRLSGVAVQAQQAQALKAQEKQSKRSTYETEQNKLLVELVPEMADPKKASELRDRAVKLLTDDLGLKDSQLSRWMQDDTGHEILANAGIQKLIADGLKYRDILGAPKAVAAKTLPPVQRPGVARPSGAVDSEAIQVLEKRLSQTGSEKDAWALYEAKLKANTRRAS